MTEAQLNRESDLIAILAAWPAGQLAAFFRSVLETLIRYAAAEIGSDAQRLIIVDAAEKLAPLHFNTRSEPRTSAAEVLQEYSDREPNSLVAALTYMLRRKRQFLDADQLEMLLSLLVEVQPDLPDEMTFFALDCIDRLPLTDRARSIAGLLPSMLVGDGLAAISLLERIEKAGLMGLPALFAALQQVSQYDPVRLGTILKLHETQFGESALEESSDDGAIPFLLKDLVGRAGSFAVLEAILKCEPTNAPALFTAAFSGQVPLFKLSRYVEKSSEEAMFIQAGERQVSLSSLMRLDMDEAWLTRFRVMGRAEIWTQLRTSDREQVGWRAAQILNQPVHQLQDA